MITHEAAYAEFRRALRQTDLSDRAIACKVARILGEDAEFKRLILKNVVVDNNLKDTDVKQAALAIFFNACSELKDKSTGKSNPPPRMDTLHRRMENWKNAGTEKGNGSAAFALEGYYIIRTWTWGQEFAESVDRKLLDDKTLDEYLGYEFKLPSSGFPFRSTNLISPQKEPEPTTKFDLHYINPEKQESGSLSAFLNDWADFIEHFTYIWSAPRKVVHYLS
tara:strand:- start:8 stop:673 length:666 start_codon:yes stop_codon:yes gene_type:complete